MNKLSVIDAIEAIYTDLERIPPHTWLSRVTEQVARLVGVGGGGLGHAYDLRGPRERWHLSKPIAHACDEALGEVVTASFSRTPSEHLLAWYGGAGASGTFSDLTKMTLDQLPGTGAASARYGIRDQVYVNAANADTDGVLFVANLSAPLKLSARQRERLAMVAAHGAAASRLLRARAEGASEPVAIFEADGRTAHVVPEHVRALPELRRRLIRIERARGASRREGSDAAARAWSGLLRGVYSTFDRYESDGRRYVVAYVNRPGLLDPRGLTESEAIVAQYAARGHADKVIAYELGIAPGTVSALLARAYRKLRVGTRAELVAKLSVPTDVLHVELDADTNVLLFSAPSADHGALVALTKVEREVAIAAARGRTVERIARERSVQTSTVKKQLASIYEKLGVTNRAELARLVAPGEE